MIGIDWGTSSLRAYRFAADGALAGRRDTPGGILTIPAGGFPDALRAVAGDWIAEGETRILMCGMVGSRQGWIEAPYLSCPAGLDGLAAAAMAVPFPDATVRLLPGLACRDAHGVPEVMRGEETQMFGAGLDAGEATLCLPGTHSKWARMRDGAVTGFATYFTGEAFAALSGHTILSRMMDAAAPHHPAGFARGLTRAKQSGGLLHHLFGVRAHALFDEMPAQEAASYLSGLLIGHEVAAALEDGVAPPIVLIGSDVLSAAYAAALGSFGIPHRIEAPDAAARGLWRLAEHIA